MMAGLSLSPILVRLKLAKLDSEKSDERKSAMEVLKSHVKGLDSKAIPLFLSEVSSTTKLETASLSAVLRISLCEFVVRVHRLKIVPHIDTIMTTIINALTLSSTPEEGSFLLQLACFKVVVAITRYVIDPTTTPVEKMRIIKSLCDPLCPSLSRFSFLPVSSNIDCLGSGAALCLRAVVDSDHWRIASDELVMMVCRHVEWALGSYPNGPNQTNAYMSLIMALAKHNALVVETYVRRFIKAGLSILNDGVVEENCQKRLWAIRMLYFLMKCTSPWGSYLQSELELIIEGMELRHFDRMDYVREAAFEAWYMAKRIAEKQFKKGPGLVTTRSNFGLREHVWRRQRIPRNGISRSTTTSPPRSRFPINVDSNIFRKTPRMLVRSQSLNGSVRADGYEELVSSTNDLAGVSTNDLAGVSTNDLPDNSTNNLADESTKDLRVDSDVQVYSPNVVYEGRTESFRSSIAFLLFCAVFAVVLVALAIWFRLPMDGQQNLPI